MDVCPELVELYNHVRTNKWYLLGIQLHLEVSELEAIKGNCGGDAEECRKAMFRGTYIHKVHTYIQYIHTYMYIHTYIHTYIHMVHTYIRYIQYLHIRGYIYILRGLYIAISI